MITLFPFIHTSTSNLESILSQGYLPGYGDKNQALLTRAIWEAEWKPDYSSISNPIYGGIGRNPYDTFLEGYGDLVLQLRYSILEKSTLCIGDSLIQRNLHYQSTPSKLIELYNSRGSSFLEFQCWIPITRLEIERIWLNRNWVSDELKEVCQRYHIPIDIPTKEYFG